LKTTSPQISTFRLQVAIPAGSRLKGFPDTSSFQLEVSLLAPVGSGWQAAVALSQSGGVTAGKVLTGVFIISPFSNRCWRLGRCLESCDGGGLGDGRGGKPFSASLKETCAKTRLAGALATLAARIKIKNNRATLIIRFMAGSPEGYARGAARWHPVGSMAGRMALKDLA